LLAAQNLSVGAFVNRLDPLEELLQKKDCFKHHFVVASVYGTFPNVIFNGGRTLIHHYSNIGEKREWYKKKNYSWYDPQGMEALVRSYNERGIGVRYTYSNSMITTKLLGDKRANLTLEIAHNALNAVITSNPLIEQYIRKHYPRYKIISSATSHKNLSVAFLKKRIDEVDLLVWPPEFNDRYDLMVKLGPDKIEVILNERCVPFCPNRQTHYKSISKSQINLNECYQQKNYLSRCPVYLASEKGNPAKTMELSDDKIIELQKLGIYNFKFVGRHYSRDEFIIETEKYLVKVKDRVYRGS
jgi:collagenase-like PrtC family protease